MKIIKNPNNKNKVICHFSDLEPIKRSNSCFLMGTFMVKNKLLFKYKKKY